MKFNNFSKMDLTDIKQSISNYGQPLSFTVWPKTRVFLQGRAEVMLVTYSGDTQMDLQMQGCTNFPKI